MTIRFGAQVSATALSDCVAALDGHAPSEKRRQCVIEVLAAYNRHRYGEAVGSTAAHFQSGRHAVRYFDEGFNQLRWVVYADPAGSKLTGERMDNLPGEGRGWTVHERDWRNLVLI